MEQVQREIREANVQKLVRQKARQLLRYYRTHGRHPQKLTMNLAYDVHSVDQLLEEAKDPWGEILEAGGSEEEEEDPPDILEFWHEQGKALLKSPTFAPSTPSALSDSDHDFTPPRAGGGSLPSPIRGMWRKPTPVTSLHMLTWGKKLRREVCLWSHVWGNRPRLHQSGGGERSDRAHLCHVDEHNRGRHCRDDGHNNRWPPILVCTGDAVRKLGKWRAS